jgi:hypothetical protein
MVPPLPVALRTAAMAQKMPNKNVPKYPKIMPYTLNSRSLSTSSALFMLTLATSSSFGSP